MNILYVTGMNAPIKDLLTGKLDNEITGLPGFYFPWRKLVNRGHIVDIVMISNFKGNYNIKVNWLKKENIIANIYAPYSEFRLFREVRIIFRFLQLLYYSLKATKVKKYDFIYCKVYEGVAGQIVAKYRKIPSGVRLFGDFTFCYPDIKRYGKYLAALIHPLEFISFVIGATFILATDDGQHCDRIYSSWSRSKKNRFYHWKTGVEISRIDSVKMVSIPSDEKYIYFAGRFDKCKRQDRVIKVLEYLHKENLKIHLYFAGESTSVNYRNYIESLVKQSNLSAYVHFLGPVKKNDLKVFAYNSIANVFMSEHSNLGNVFYEVFSVGSIVISLRNRSLEEFILNGINGFLVDDEKEACTIIKKILDGEIDIKKIREKALETSKEKFLTIDERFNDEIALIERTAKISREKM